MQTPTRLSWDSAEHLREALQQRAEGIGLSLQRVGNGRSRTFTIREPQGRHHVVIAIAEHGRRRAKETDQIWVGMPTAFLEALMQPGADAGRAYILVIDRWSHDLVVVPFELVTRALDFKERHHGTPGHISFDIKHTSLGYALVTPLGEDQIRLDAINTLAPVFRSFEPVQA